MQINYCKVDQYTNINSNFLKSLDLKYFEIFLDNAFNIDLNSLQSLVNTLKALNKKVILNTCNFEIIYDLNPDAIIYNNSILNINGELDDILEYCQEKNILAVEQMTNFDDDDFAVLSYKSSLYPKRIIEINTLSYSTEYLYKYLTKLKSFSNVYWKNLPICVAEQFNLNVTYDLPYIEAKNNNYRPYMIDTNKFFKRKSCLNCLNFKNCIGFYKEKPFNTLYNCKKVLNYCNLIEENLK